MAGNDDVINTLKLNIDVSIKGQQEMDAFQRHLEELAATLERIEPLLSRFQSAYASAVRAMSNALPRITAGVTNATQGAAPTARATAENHVTDVQNQFVEAEEDAVEATESYNRSMAELSRACRTYSQRLLGASNLPSTDTAPRGTWSENPNQYNGYQRQHNVYDANYEEIIPPLQRIQTLFDGVARAGASVGRVLSEIGRNIGGRAVTNIQKYAKAFSNLIHSFTRILKYRIIRSIIRGIADGFKTGIQNLARYSKEFNELMSQFSTASLYGKNAVATLAEPILQYLIPVFVKLVNVCVNVINKINELRATLQGTGTVWYKAEEYQVDYAASLDKSNKSAKALKNTLLGFDEINRLDDKTSALNNGEDYSKMFSTHKVAQMTDEAIERVQYMIRTIERLLGAAAMVVGAILVATGNLPLGVAFLIAGAYLTAKSLDWSFAEKKIGNTLSKIEAIVGVACLAIGAIIAFACPSHMGLGIGLMIIGAMSLAASIVLDWSNISNKVQDVCTVIATFLGGMALVIGAIITFACPAHMALGIALMAMGAVTLATTMALNWDNMSNKIRTICSIILDILGRAALVVGAILAFSTVNIPLGIALMVIGAASLATEAALNWDTVKKKIIEKKDQISEVLTKGGAAMMAVGAMLAFSGVGIPLGLGLIAAGAALYFGGKVTENYDDSGFINSVRRTMVKMKNEVADAINTVIDWINKVFKTQLQHIQIGVSARVSHSGESHSSHSGQFASGGFPETGEMFIARESGPELVGTLGNRTAVANNAQITAGIKQAAYEGFKQAMSESGSSGSTTFVAQLNGKTLFEEVVRQNNNSVRATGYNQLVGV